MEVRFILNGHMELSLDVKLSSSPVNLMASLCNILNIMRKWTLYVIVCMMPIVQSLQIWNILEVPDNSPTCPLLGIGILCDNMYSCMWMGAITIQSIKQFSCEINTIDPFISDSSRISEELLWCQVIYTFKRSCASFATNYLCFNIKCLSMKIITFQILKTFFETVLTFNV